MADKFLYSLLYNRFSHAGLWRRCRMYCCTWTRPSTTNDDRALQHCVEAVHGWRWCNHRTRRRLEAYVKSNAVD